MYYIICDLFSGVVEEVLKTETSCFHNLNEFVIYDLKRASRPVFITLFEWYFSVALCLCSTPCHKFTLCQYFTTCLSV